MIDSVRFEGVFVAEQTHYMCRAEGGVFRAPMVDVTISDGSAYIRVGAIVELVRNPITDDSEGRKQVWPKGDSATACIGRVEISCETGTVVGACDGIWACP
ncbi:MAG: hypothetical protein JWM91_4419 [Rhodospirillales bacterium]|nr:hypothetical protein [Rhodospirillales bacterium]